VCPPIGVNVRYGDSCGYRQFRRRTSVSGSIGRSAINRPPPRKTVVILVGGNRREPDRFAPGGYHPRTGFFPGIAIHCPRPKAAGEEAGGRAGWGQRGGIYEFRRLRGGGEPPPRSPPPEAMPTTVPCPGESGNSLDPISTSSIRCTMEYVRAYGGANPLPGPHPPKAMPTTVPCPGESGNSPDPASSTGLHQIRVSSN